METKEITRLDLAKGGTTLKQGHYETLAFTPRNANGEVVDLTNKTIEVVIVNGRSIVYETTGTFDSSDSTIKFPISKNFGHGDMWMEITVTDPADATYRQKFPTSEYEGRLKFIRSADDVDYVGFSGKTVAVFEADQAEFKNEMQRSFDLAVAAVSPDAEVADARGGEVLLGTRLDKDKQELTLQLAEKVSIRVFESMPSASELPEGYLGLILPPPIPFFPFNYLFEGVNGQAWDMNHFSNVEYQGYGTVMDKVASFSEILNNQGHMKVVKNSSTGLASVENKGQFSINLTSGKKWRVKLDIKRTVINGTDKGNVGISISPSDTLSSYYPLTGLLTDGFAAYLSNDSVDNTVKARFRKYVGGTQVTDGFVAKTGGFAAVAGERLGLPEDVFYSVEVIVSTTNVKLLIDGTQYLDLTEDFSVLNSAGCKLVIWGANYDANSLTVEHYFDNLLVEEVI